MPYSTVGRHAVAISHDIWLSTVQNMNVIEEYSPILGAKLVNNKMSGKIPPNRKLQRFQQKPSIILLPLFH